jgi:glycoprotein endo-alpha-1,2-mannosidase
MYSPTALIRIASSALAAALITATLVAARSGAQPTLRADSQGSVAIFFYPWYGTPAANGSYEHWAQRGAVPPVSIASNFYPARGVYSSTDASVLRAQMSDMATAGIDTVIVSWWGTGSVEDQRLPEVMAAARAAGLRVAIHLEPYTGRTPASAATDITRLEALGITDFYVYDSTQDDDAAWAAANASLTGVRVFADTALPGKAAAGGFAGFYTYDIYTYTGWSFDRLCAAAAKRGLVCAPSVGPGYDARRATGSPDIRPRYRGWTYDFMWRQAIRARAPVVTITSYNEWHEGTQIEPARYAGTAYDSYDGAWGLQGKPAQRAYLDRTAYWILRYRARLAGAAGTPATSQ